MKHTVVGPRLLVEVPKVDSTSTTKTFKGSSILMPDEMAMKEQQEHTVAKIVQLGNTAYTNPYDGTKETPWCKVGDLVHISRYGAVRLKGEKADLVEYWIVNDKDILSIESE